MEDEINIDNIEVIGNNLPSKSLKEIVNQFPIAIIHFLRHLNCAFCKHSVDEIAKFLRQNPDFPPIIFVHTSKIEKANQFFAKRMENVMHISDPDQVLYKIFKINRMNAVSFASPTFLKRLAKLMFRGYYNELPEDKEDPAVLTGTFLYYQGKLRWSHRAKLPGDEPDWKKLNLLKTAKK